MRFEVRNLQQFAAEVMLPASVGPRLLAAVSAPPAFSQNQKTSSSSTTTIGSVDPFTGKVVPTTNLPSGFQATPQFVSGKVVMDDGAPPPDGVNLERVCGGTAHIEGHTDAKGGFGFEMGKDPVQDASFNGQAVINPNAPVISSDIGADPNRPYRNCEIRANLPGYRLDSISLATYRPSENPNIGTIMLHRMTSVEGSVISANTAGAPRNASKEYEKGLELLKKGKTEDAVQAFNKAVDVYSNFAAAWFELGKLQMSLQQVTDAQKSFESAVKAEPKFISPYLQLSELAFKAKQWQQVADVTDRLLKLDAVDFPQMYYYNALAYYALQRGDPAEKSFRETIRLDPQNHYPKAHQFLAAILVAKKDKDIAGATAELRTYVQLAPTAPDAQTARRQLFELEKIARENSRAGK